MNNNLLLQDVKSIHTGSLVKMVLLVICLLTVLACKDDREHLSKPIPAVQAAAVAPAPLTHHDAATSASYKIIHDQTVFAGQMQPARILVDKIKHAVVGIGILESKTRGLRYTHLGTGLIISKEGSVLLHSEVISRHIINGLYKYKVTIFDAGHRHQFDAGLAAYDPEAGLAMLHIQMPQPYSLPFLALKKPAVLRSGDWVLSIGTPDGMHLKVAAGIAGSANQSLITESIRLTNLIQTNFNLGEGGKGFPVFDMNGGLAGFHMGRDLSRPVDGFSPVFSGTW